MRCAVRRIRTGGLFASLAVFLVVLPLCVGVAVGSGVPAELGLVTGVVGGLVAGAPRGGGPRVSGPAAGLTVLVYEAVRTYGLDVLGVLVLGAGLVQLGLGVLRLGRWFRAVSVAVVQGMLGGIGLMLIVGQVYALGDTTAPTGGLRALAGLAALPGRVDPGALSVAGATMVVLLLWPRWRRGARVVPAALVAVVPAAALAWLCGLDVRRVEVHGLMAAVRVPEAADVGRLAELGVIGTVVAFALVSSAQSLYGATAADRERGRARGEHDRELMAQGVGNAVCGVLGALPMAAVSLGDAVRVRGATDVGVAADWRVGPWSRAVRVLCAMWLLAFVCAVPGVLGLVPVAALAAVLVYVGWRLVPVRQVRRLWREDRGEVVVVAVTAGGVLVAGLFEGVLVGLALAVAKTAWDASHVQVEIEDRGEAGLVVRVAGHATFLRLPKLLDALEGLPRERAVRLELGGLRHLDHACAAALEGWAAGRGQEVTAAGLVATSRMTS